MGSSFSLVDHLRPYCEASALALCPCCVWAPRPSNGRGVQPRRRAIILCLAVDGGRPCGHHRRRPAAPGVRARRRRRAACATPRLRDGKVAGGRPVCAAGAAAALLRQKGSPQDCRRALT
eukprot:363879-Chlamydomonas_euryale.AAC.13